jgi:arylsulfatase
MYWATGVAHAPHHAPESWLRKFRGKFDMGWDKAREAILKQQVQQGIVPRGTTLSARPDIIPAWDSLPAEERKLYSRQMEAFAASLAYTDAQFGKILDALEASGELDNTVIVIVSDNGASAEGGPNGLHNEAAVTGGSPPGVAGNMKFYDRWGGPDTFPHYSNGWAMAGDTPLKYWKQVAHEGGSRVPLIVSWPKGIGARGEVRRGFTHVSDVAPTILDIAGVPLAETVNNVKQQPMQGHSFAASFGKPGALDPNRVQYAELYGNRAVWQGNWSLVAEHRIATWDWATAKTFDEPWELYDLSKDMGQNNDVAAQHPERVKAMGDAFAAMAKRDNVAPMHNLSDTAAENFAKGRADFMRRGGKWHYPGPVSNLTQTVAPPVNIQGFTMTATLGLADGSTTGPIFAYGGQLAGIGMYLDDGRPALILNSLSGETATVMASGALPAGEHVITLDFDKGEVGKDRSAAYSVTIKAGEKVLAQRTLSFKLAQYFGIPETFGVGNDEGSPVLKGYAAGTPFPGTISDVTFDFSGSEAGGVELH